MKKTVISIISAFIMIASFSAFATETANPLKKFDSTSIISV